MTKLTESFLIPLTEGWKTVDAGKTSIRIKGVALKGDAVSLNQRKYVAAELKKATNTFINKPVNINHDNTQKVGRITWMDYDEGTDLLTYEAEITHPHTVQMLRNRSAEIKGVSIQADYLFNNCSRCGKRFYTEEEWYSHCTKEEYMRDLPKEPHGIIGNALSLVLSPETPGFPQSTVELAEMYRREVLRLSETITKIKIEEETYLSNKLSESGVAVVHSKNVVPQTLNKIEEQKPNVAVPATPLTQPEHETKPLETPFTNPTLTASSLIEIKQTTPTTLTLKESKLSPLKETTVKLSLGEPFGGYDNFEACVKANSDKENPEAFCGKMKHETEEIVNVKAQLKEVAAKINELVADANCKVSVSLPDNGDVKALRESMQAELAKIFETVGAIKIPEYKDDLTWKDIKPYDDASIKADFNTQIKAVTEVLGLHTQKIDNIKPYDDKAIKEAVAAIKPYDDTAIKADIAAMQKALESVAKITEQVNKIVDAKAKLEEWYKANLAAYEKDIKEYYKPIEEKLRKLEEKQLKETVRTDNLEEKLQPQFKGKNPTLTTQTQTYTPRNPLEAK